MKPGSEDQVEDDARKHVPVELRTVKPEGLVHPAKEVLQRFMVGTASPAEARAVVAHLLKGCPDCLGVTRRLWNFGEEEPFGASVCTLPVARQAGVNQ
jgi:hypothetical protein